MVALGDVLRAVRRRIPGRGDTEPSAEAVELAGEARGEGVTPRVLGNLAGRSKRSLLEYVDADEQPEYVLRGNQVIIDDGDSYVTEYPTRDTQVLVSDRRIVIVLGGRLSDDVWEMALGDVREAYVDDEGWKEYLVLEATREGESLAFFVDVTVEDEAADLLSSVEYVRDRAT